MMIITKTFKFEAAHQLLEHDGDCARLHGHSYSFTLGICGQMLGSGPKRNMVLDYGDLGEVGKKIRDMLDHHFLNDVTSESMTTAEFLCKWIYDRVEEEIPDLWSVEVSETESTSCSYCPIQSRLIELGRKELYSIQERLYSNVKIGEPDECWPFQGSKDEDGYGYCTYAPAGIHKSHRLAVWLTGREVDELVVLHECDNPSCCNPAHLIVGTHADNEKDKDAKGRRPKGEEHGGSVITDDQVSLLWKAYQEKPTRYFAAAWGIRLNVSSNVIGNIIKGWSHNHITGLPKRGKRKS